MFQEYRKKPSVVRAAKWIDPENPPTGIWDVRKEWKKCCENDAKYFGKVTTLEGTVRINLGDYLVMGIAGELYPCRADIFEELHEPNGDFEFVVDDQTVQVKSFYVDNSARI